MKRFSPKINLLINGPGGELPGLQQAHGLSLEFPDQITPGKQEPEHQETEDAPLTPIRPNTPSFGDVLVSQGKVHDDVTFQILKCQSSLAGGLLEHQPKNSTLFLKIKFTSLP